MIDDPQAMTLTIAGHAIRDIASFYDEINRVFMACEDWSLGPSLDALDDLFYGHVARCNPVRLAKECGDLEGSAR